MSKARSLRTCSLSGGSSPMSLSSACRFGRDSALRTAAPPSRGFWACMASRSAFALTDAKGRHVLTLARYSLPLQQLLEEEPRARLLGAREHLLRRGLLGDQALVHEDDPVGNLAGEAHLVGDDEHRHAAAGEVAHHAPDPAHHPGGERPPPPLAPPPPGAPGGAPGGPGPPP